MLSYIICGGSRIETHRRESTNNIRQVDFASTRPCPHRRRIPWHTTGFC